MRALRKQSDRPIYNPRTGNFDFVEVPNYLTQEEYSRIRKDKSPMYVQTATMRVPVFYVQELSGSNGRAKLYVADNTLYLRSYDTIVCSIYKCYADGQYHNYFTRYWEDWSSTTSKHINAFLHDYGNGKQMSKKEWMDFPLYTQVEL